MQIAKRIAMGARLTLQLGDERESVPEQADCERCDGVAWRVSE